METITLLQRGFAIVLIVAYFLIIWTDMKKKVITRVYLTLFFLAAVIISVVYYLKRIEMKEELLQVLAIASVGSNMEQRLANSNSYDKLLADLEKKEQRLKEIKESQSFIDKLCGRSKDVDTLVYQTLQLLQNQKLRIMHLNSKSSYFYKPSSSKNASTELKMMGLDDLNRNYINSGFKVDHSAMFVKNNVVLVRIVETAKDSILYQQFYVPKDSINSFVLPNVFKDDNVELQMGYISKHDTTTFHYIKSIPYGK